MTSGQLQRRTFLAALAGSLPAAAAFGRPTVASGARAAGGPEQSPPPATSFDLDAGNAPVELIIPAVIPVLYRRMSPKGNDATLVLRVTTMLTNAWFDTIAPYHPTAVGVCSLHGRRPLSEATDRSRNLAILQASVPVLESLFPEETEEWRGLAAAHRPASPTAADPRALAIGDASGAAVVDARIDDGMNQRGDLGDWRYHAQPYADYTGYLPRNTSDELTDPARWQPLVVADRIGIFRAQRFVTPQMGRTKPYTYTDPSEFAVAPPTASQRPSSAAYRQQAAHVLAASANLTDEQKMKAELFDNKILGLGFSALFAAQSNQLDLARFVEYDFLTNVASFDAAIAVWDAKARFDTVRPTSAIRYLYANDNVAAWGGPGRGTVRDLPGATWSSYLGTADHPEYPSGSSALCYAHAESSRRYFGSDRLNWEIPVPRGSSVFEPGVTPERDLTLRFATWSDLAEDCGNSRVWGGVHFQPAVTAAIPVGERIGKLAAEFVAAHLAGDVLPAARATSAPTAQTQ